MLMDFLTKLNPGLVIGGVVLFLLLTSVIFALIRGVTKSRIRFGCLVFCAVAAFITIAVAKGKIDSIYTHFAPKIQNFLVSRDMEDLWNFINESSNSRETVEASIGALAAPLVFPVVFLAFKIVTWVIYCIVTLILHGVIKRREERRRLRPLRSLGYGLLTFLLITFVWITPVYAYLQLGTSLINAANEANLISEDMQEKVDEETINKVNNNPVIKVYGKLGGKQMSKSLTSMKVQGEKTSLTAELDLMVPLAQNYATLKNAGSIENWGAEEAAAIKNIAGSLGDSKLVASLVGDLIGQATDQWLAGETFFGAAKPSMGEYLDPMLNIVLEDIGKDSKSLTAISADFKTVGDLLSIFVRDGVLAKLNDTDGLMELLTQGTTVKDMIEVLKSNETLSNLIPEFTKIGMKAVGEMLNNLVDADQLAQFEEFFDEMSDEINEVLEQIDLETLRNEEARQQLTDTLQEELQNAGVDVQLSDDVVELYAEVILSEFEGKDHITVDDIKELFGLYAGSDEDLSEFEIPEEFIEKE